MDDWPTFSGLVGYQSCKVVREKIDGLESTCSLMKRRGNDMAIMTVFNSEGQILCSLAGKEAGQEHTYEVCNRLVRKG